MNIGELRHPLDVEAFTMTQDPNTGEMLEGWATVGMVWGKVNGIQGKEFLASSATQAETTYRITLRYDASLTTKHRLKDGDTTYEIEALLPDNRRRTLVCMAKVLEA